MDTKLCNSCGEVKPLGDFHRRTQRSGNIGYQHKCKECSLRYSAIWEANNKERRRHQPSRHTYRATYEQRLMRRLSQYGLTREAYDAMLVAQDYRCAICQTETWGYETNSPSIDHKHPNKHDVRGLLCNNCNRVLGYAHDNSEVLMKSIEYLARDRRADAKEDVE